MLIFYFRGLENQSNESLALGSRPITISKTSNFLFYILICEASAHTLFAYLMTTISFST